MAYVITDCRGARLGPVYPDRKAVRKGGRVFVRNGYTVMIYRATDTGEILSYSSDDTAAVHKGGK